MEQSLPDYLSLFHCFLTKRGENRMKHIFKSIAVASLLVFVSANAEVNLTNGIKNLNEKNAKKFNSEEWFDNYKKEREFEKSWWDKMWEAEYKKAYDEEVKRVKRKKRPIDKTLITLSAKWSAFCRVKDRFFSEKNSFIIETSPKRKEMEAYRDMLMKQCLQAESDFYSYLRDR